MHSKSSSKPSNCVKKDRKSYEPRFSLSSKKNSTR